MTAVLSYTKSLNDILFVPKNAIGILLKSMFFLIVIFTVGTVSASDASEVKTQSEVTGRKPLKEHFVYKGVADGLREKYNINDLLVSEITLEPPKSRWIENEKAYYRNFFKNTTYDVLIVPFQTQDHGVDLIGRKLMTYLLAWCIERNTSLKVAPLDLVYPALGRLARFYDENEVYSLAKNLGVSRIIWGYAGTQKVNKENDNVKYRTNYDEEILDFNFSIVDQKIEKGERRGDDRFATWGSRAIHPESLPSSIFEENLEQVMRFLKLPYTPQRMYSKVKSGSKYTVPSSLNEVVHLKESSRIQKGYMLQLLAALAPTEYEKNFLYIQSIISVFEIEKDNIDRGLIEARAYMHLYRRPAAVRLLNGVESKEAMAIKAYADANLPELVNYTKAVEPSILKLLSELEMYKLKNKYKHEIADADKQEILKQYPDWKYLLTIRLALGDRWQRESNVALKRILDEIFPIPGYSYGDLAKGLRMDRNSGNSNQYRDELLFKNHILISLKEVGKERLNSKHGDINMKSAVLTALESVGLYNLIQEIGFWGFTQGVPENGLKIADEILNRYKGHPYFEIYKAMVLDSTGYGRNASERKNLEDQAFYLALNAMYWNGRQNWVHINAKQYLLHNPELEKLYITPKSLEYAIGRDYPFRTNIVLYDDLKPLINLLPWTHTDMMFHMNAYDEFKSTKKNKKAQEVMTDIKRRFNGHPAKAKFLLERETAMNKNQDLEQFYLTQIENGTAQWNIYKKLASIYIEKEEYDNAKDVFEKYPKLKKAEDYHSVEVSNFAAVVAGEFFWRGAVKQALPFLNLCDALDTGSGLCLQAQEQLSILQKDFGKAATISLNAAKRYNDFEGYGNCMTYLHLLGEHDTAWSMFNTLLGRYQEPKLWESALIGMRIQSKDINEISTWIDQIITIDGQQKAHGLPARFFVMNLMDRGQRQELTKYARGVEELSFYIPNSVCFGPEGTWYWNPEGKAPGWGPGYAKKRSSDPPLFYSLFSKAYNEIKIKQFTDAYNHLEKMSRYYPIGVSNTGGPLKSYLVWSGLKSGHETEIKNFLYRELTASDIIISDCLHPKMVERMKKQYRETPPELDIELSLAAFLGARGDHDKALDHLNNCFNIKLDRNSSRPIHAWYQTFELCEWLYNDSADRRYADLILKWSKRFQAIQPMYSWLYSFESKFSSNKDDVIRAMALLKRLDPESDLIKNADEHMMQKIEQWLKENKPFKIKRVVDMNKKMAL